ncbi:MAG TPA: hypothetical protein VMU95_35870 [Trebonia sp.]|nr:hypothetical protein [Trebonia sp.]
MVGGSLTYAKVSADGPAFGFSSFVAEERNGVWQPSRALTGLAAQFATTHDGIQSLSCSSQGACAAVGEYGTRSSRGVFVVTERDGHWGTAIPVPGLARLGTNAAVQANGLACWTAGNCLLAGTYGPAATTGSDGGHVFWASEVSGAWGPAVSLADPPGLGTGVSASVTGVACSHDGGCVIAADYTDAAHQDHEVLSTVTGGKLATSTELGQAMISAVSCPSAGACVAAGIDSGHAQAVAFASHGRTWSTTQVPGLDSPSGLACTGPGTCTMSGVSSAAGNPAAVASQVSGTWRPSVALPGAASLRGAQLTLLSCADARDCVTGGYADTGQRDARGILTSQPFIAVEKAGTWSAARDVPGIAGLAGGRGSSLTAIACPAPGAWIAAGNYDPGQAISAEDSFLGLTSSLVPFVIASAS